MKEKVMELLKNKKTIGIAVAVVVALIVIVLLVNVVFSSKPKKYEDKVKDVVKAMASESKMKDAINDKLIDLKGAAAWKEADQESEDFKKEYKKLKKDSDEIEDMEDGLKKYAKQYELADCKVKNIKEPKKDKDNKNIYSVTATAVMNYPNGGYSDVENQIKVIFYKGKVIDIINKDTNISVFELATELNK